MRKLLQGLAFTFAMLTLSALYGAGAQTMPATIGTATDAQLIQASFVSDIQNAPAPQWAAIVGGAVIGGALAETFLDGGLFSLAGLVIGAVVGNQWYERGYWPF